MHWHAWKDLCRPKSQGGMGFRNLVAFNKALLAKQMWRIIKYPDSLLAKVMEERYVRSKPILGVKIKANASFIWRSLCWSRSILSHGMLWKVGDGNNIGIGKDNFVPNLKGTSLHSLVNFENNDSVGQFITSYREWDMEKLEMVFGIYFANIISGVCINEVGKDCCIWTLGPSKLYSVKAGYLAEIGFYETHDNSSETPKMDWNALIWSKTMPPKVKIFLWRLLKNSLAVPMSLRRHHIQVHGRCEMCRKEWGTELHCIFLCENMSKIWKNSQYWHILKQRKKMSMMEVGTAIWKACSEKDYEIWATTAYFAWLFACKKKFQPNKTHVEVEIDHSIRLLEDFEAAKSVIQCNNIFGVEIGAKVWKPPPRGVFRLDVDAAVDWDNGYFGYGAVVRDWKGSLSAALSMPACRPYCVLDAEINVVLYGVGLCLQEGLVPVDIYSDSLLTVRLFADRDKGIGYMEQELPSLAQAFHDGFIRSFSHVFRCAKIVAHSLVRFGARGDGMVVWNSTFPQWLRTLVE